MNEMYKQIQSEKKKSTKEKLKEIKHIGPHGLRVLSLLSIIA